MHLGGEFGLENKVSDDDAKTCCAGVLHEESTSTRFSCGLCGSRQWGFFCAGARGAGAGASSSGEADLHLHSQSVA